MALNNKLRKIVDQPVWEWMRYSPFTLSANTTFITTQAADTGSWQHRYLYGLASTTMYRYDTYSDSWSIMGTMFPTSPASTISGVWKKDDGHVGRFISATSGSKLATGAFLNESAVVGLKIKVISGKGRGIERTIVQSSRPVTHEYLTVTSFSNTATTIGSISDSSKKWIPNQWRGYQVRVYLGTSQQYFIRRILYNNNDTLFFANAEWHAIDPQAAYMHVYDSNVINPTANASRAVIQSDTIEVDTPWPTDLDYSSRFEINTGMLHTVQNISTNALYLHYLYDPLLANWIPGHVMSGLLPQYLADTELQVESIDGSLTPVFTSGSLTFGDSRTAQDTTKSWNINQWANYRFINTTTGYERAIDSNDSNTMYFKQDLDVPASGSHTYQIIHDSDKLYMNGGNFSTMVQYSCRTNTWYQGQRFDEGVLNTAYARFSSSFEVLHPITSITRVGQVATVSTITGHPFATGDIIYISGALGSDSQFYNGTFVVTSSYPLSATIASSTQPTQFTYWMSGTPSANATLSAHTTTQVFDASKSWRPNEYVGHVVQIYSSSPTAPTVQYRRITANTSQSISVGTALSAVTSGIWGYTILNSASFGASEGLSKSRLTLTSSYSVTGSTVSGQPYVFVSSSFLPIVQQIPLGLPITGSSIAANTFFRSIDTSNPAFVTMSLNANATSTLNNTVVTLDAAATVGHGSSTAVGTTTTLIDSTKIWPTNFWIGARVKFVAGTGVGQESTISSNTSNTLTFAAVTTAPGTDTVYSILPIAPRNTVSTTAGAGGADLKWVYGTADTSITSPLVLGKYIWCFQAGSTMRFEKYNIASMQYEYPFIMPFSHMTSENLTTGTMYAYDGKGRIYIQPNSSARIIYIDTDRDRSETAGQIPAGMSTARQGRRMHIKKTEDGLDYLYIGRHSDTPLWRQLIWF